MTVEFVERRRQKRQRALLTGRVFFNARASTMDCVVRDLTPIGARLRFGGPPLVPEVFDLHIEGKGDARRARRIWMRDREIGVTFE